MFRKQTELKELQRKYDASKQRNANLQATIDCLRLDLEKAREDKEFFENAATSSRKALADMEAKVLKQAKTIREQTEADILLNALKAVGIVQDKEEKTKEHYAEEQLRLSSLLNQVRQQNLSSPLATQSPLQRAYGSLDAFIP